MGPGFPTRWDKGDAEAALAASESVIEGSIDTTRQEHFYEETNVVLVVPPSNADDEFKIFASTPNVILTQHTIATVLGLPFSRIHITVKRVSQKYDISVYNNSDWLLLWWENVQIHPSHLWSCSCCSHVWTSRPPPSHKVRIYCKIFA